MKDSIKKWLWKISGAEERFKKYREQAEELGLQLKYYKEKAALVKVSCKPGEWCEHCEKSYPTDMIIYSSINGKEGAVKTYGCKLRIPCTDFKEVAKE